MRTVPIDNTSVAQGVKTLRVLAMNIDLGNLRSLNNSQQTKLVIRGLSTKTSES